MGRDAERTLRRSHNQSECASEVTKLQTGGDHNGGNHKPPCFLALGQSDQGDARHGARDHENQQWVRQAQTQSRAEYNAEDGEDDHWLATNSRVSSLPGCRSSGSACVREDWLPAWTRLSTVCSSSSPGWFLGRSRRAPARLEATEHIVLRRSRPGGSLKVMLQVLVAPAKCSPFGCRCRSDSVEENDPRARRACLFRRSGSGADNRRRPSRWGTPVVLFVKAARARRALD
jgi:hypothetical protein